MVKSLLCRTWAAQLAGCLRRGSPVPLRVRPPTGEPDAGDLHVRFGGRGRRDDCLSLPLSRISVLFAASRGWPAFAGHSTVRSARRWKGLFPTSLLILMPMGLGPATHVFSCVPQQFMDSRAKPGHSTGSAA